MALENRTVVIDGLPREVPFDTELDAPAFSVPKPPKSEEVPAEASKTTAARPSRKKKVKAVASPQAVDAVEEQPAPKATPDDAVP